MYILQKQKWRGGNRANGLLPVSSSRLAELLGIGIITPRILPRRREVVINWGVVNVPSNLQYSTLLNTPEAIRTASNKLKSFQAFKEASVNIPTFFTDKEEAFDYVDNGKIVVCRQKLTGSKGEGIVIARTKEEVVDAPLYVLYSRKKWEYRLHVINGEVVHVQQKRRLSAAELQVRGIEFREPLIRNLTNGYIFSQELDHNQSSNVYGEMVSESKKAVSSLSLDFGAVDVIVRRNGEVKVLEVNTAPGLEGTTLQKYKEAFEVFK